MVQLETPSASGQQGVVWSSSEAMSLYFGSGNASAGVYSYRREYSTPRHGLYCSTLWAGDDDHEPSNIASVHLLSAVCAGSIPKELGALGELTTLGLENNKLTGEAVRAENVARDQL